jgi:uncharacterized protein (TIGR03790 family)
MLALAALPRLWAQSDAPPMSQSLVASPLTDTNDLSAPLLSQPETTPPAGLPGQEASPLPSSVPTLQPPPEDLSAHLLVVYNTADPDAHDLAAYYASRRAIPDERVLAIKCPTQDEITRADYEETIREPIISYLFQKDWMARHGETVRLGNRQMDLLIATRNDIWAIVLIRGIPLKIAPDPTSNDAVQDNPELSTNAAAVDSELATLPVFGLPAGGFEPNPFYDGNLLGLPRLGPLMATKMIMVTRLDAPTAADVHRMIDDSLYAEQNRLCGLAVIDSRGLINPNDHYTIGDDWLRKARDLLSADGWAIDFDDKDAVLPPTDPLNHVAIYLGWYSGAICGPWCTPPDRFERGAIAYHLHSFSAVTIHSTTGAWVGPLLDHGAAASLGTVYEPYLGLCPRFDILTKRLLDGNYYAEAAYACQHALSWMTTVVGDPLYRPFAVPLDDALQASSPGPSSQHDWLLLQQIQRDLRMHGGSVSSDALISALDTPTTGPVAREGLGDLLLGFDSPTSTAAAVLAYQDALKLEPAPLDQVRLGLKIAQIDFTHGEHDAGTAQLRDLARQFPDEAQRFGLMAMIAPPAQSTSSVPVGPR